MKANTYLHLGIIAIFLAFTSACASKINTSFVAERWSTTLAAFNIDAVFPPRYMQVGDMYLVLVNTNIELDKDRYKRRAILLGRVDVRPEMEKDLRALLQLPPSSVADPNVNIFEAPPKVTRLRPTAYPGFNIAEFTEADIGVAFPVQLFRSLFGIASNRQLAMSISIPNAEDYELPAFEAYDALASFCAPSPSVRPCSLNEKKIKLALNSIMEPGDPEDLIPKIVIVTHVFYAREIDYFFSTRATAAFSASTTPLINPLPASDKTTASTSSSTSTTKTTSTISSDIQQEIQAIQAQVDDLGKQVGMVGLGGAGHLVAAGSEGVILRQSFNFPVAIGYRGLWIEVKADPSPQTSSTPSNTQKAPSP